LRRRLGDGAPGDAMVTYRKPEQLGPCGSQPARDGNAMRTRRYRFSTQLMLSCVARLAMCGNAALAMVVSSLDQHGQHHRDGDEQAPCRIELLLDGHDQF
jgi:hypothetical protein